MIRLRLDLAYDGSDFHGWAAQPGRRTVQGTLQQAIGEALALAGCSPRQMVTVAGRTDAGVHARGQVAHLDADIGIDDAPKLASQVARLLPADMALNAMTVAPEGFDARFSAIGRTYCYRLWPAASRPDPLLRHMVTGLHWPLDATAMATAAASLCGLHDFTPFCKPKEGGTAIRHLRRFDVITNGQVIECWLEADAFCHNMVRSLVGAVTEVGAHRRDMGWLARVAAAPARAQDVPVLPPGGLTLESVQYPADDQLAARAAQARQLRALT